MNGTFTSEPVPFLRNLSEPGARFRAAAPNHPEALLEEPQAFQAVREKSHLVGHWTNYLYRWSLGQMLGFEFGRLSILGLNLGVSVGGSLVFLSND